MAVSVILKIMAPALALLSDLISTKIFFGNGKWSYDLVEAAKAKNLKLYEYFKYLLEEISEGIDYKKYLVC